MASFKQQLINDLLKAKAKAEAEVESARSNLNAAVIEVDRIENALDVIAQFTGGVPMTPVSASFTGNIDVTPPPIVALDAYGLSIPGGAEIVLREAGQPLRNKQVAERMLAGGFRYELGGAKLRNSVGVMLHRRSKERKTFVKIAPGVFDLCERQNGTGENNTPETADTASGAVGSPAPQVGG